MQLLAVVGCRQYGVSTETPLELAMPLSSIEYYDQAALLDRLTMGIKNSGESVVFLVGSAVTAPLQIGGAGVPNVQGVIDLIKKQFPAEQTAAFEREIQQSPQPYQAAFSYLIGRRGQTAANNIIKRAVMMARLDACASAANLSDADCDNLDQGNENWFLNPAVKSLGRLVALQPEKFGQTILTTNFDPLLEVAIRGAGALTYRTVLHREGNLNQTHSEGCHVVHLHGYWHGTDTLHTNRQLNQSRPRLKSSIKSLVESKILVVVGYGGWDDTFTEALQEIIQDDTARPEIIWTFFAEDPPKESPLIESLSAGLDRGRVSLYRGIDCHSFFPALLEKWEHSSSSQQTVNYVVSIKKGEDETSLTGREEDRPPLVEFFVGREKELDTLTSMSQRAVFLTGFGGQGKSTIAARYFALAQQNHSYDEYVWRDCKEEGERFENQLIDIIVRLRTY